MLLLLVVVAACRATVGGAARGVQHAGDHAAQLARQAAGAVGGHRRGAARLGPPCGGGAANYSKYPPIASQGPQVVVEEVVVVLPGCSQELHCSAVPWADAQALQLGQPPLALALELALALAEQACCPQGPGAAALQVAAFCAFARLWIAHPALCALRSAWSCGSLQYVHIWSLWEALSGALLLTHSSCSVGIRMPRRHGMRGRCMHAFTHDVPVTGITGELGGGAVGGVCGSVCLARMHEH